MSTWRSNQLSYYPRRRNMLANQTLFGKHLALAHGYWTELIKPGELAVDATCGNGHDTKFLLSLTDRVIACDVQEAAITATRERTGMEPLLCCHAELPLQIAEPVKLAVYNLGYLPGSDKALTTRLETTLTSVERFLPKVTGAISITCYPGHDEGAREEEALLEWAAKLPSNRWSVCHHRWLNRARSPSLLFISAIM
jgi:Putative rRNA methylase